MFQRLQGVLLAVTLLFLAPGHALAEETPAPGNVLEAEFSVHTATSVYTPSTMMDAAFGGGVHLLVFGDRRSGAEVFLHGARVSPEGVLLDPNGFRISGPVNFQRAPVVAFNGTRFLAVWENDGMGNSGDILGRFIEPDGTLPAPAFTISNGTNRQFNPGIGSDGTDFMVLWNDDRNWTSDIYGTKVLADGTVANPSGVALCTADKSQLGPSLAFDGTDYLVAWQDYRGGDYNVYLRRLGKTGTWNGSESILDGGASDQVSPRVVLGTDRFLVAWNDYPANQVMTSLVTTAGAATPHVALTAGQYPQPSFRPGAAFSGDQYLVSWAGPSGGNESPLRAARLGADGALKDPSGLTLPTLYTESSSGNTTVTWDGTNFLVAASNARRGLRSILVDPDGQVLGDPLLVSRAAGIQTKPVVASGRNGSWLATMTNQRLDDSGTMVWELLGVLFNNLGEPLGQPSVLFPAYGSGHTAGFTGRYFLVASTQGQYPVARIQGRTFQNGSLGEANPFELVPGLAGQQTQPALGCASSGCLLVFMEILSAGMGGNYGVLRGARINEYGVTQDPASFVIGAAGEKLDTYNTTLAVAYSGTHYWVLRVYNNSDLRLTRVNNSSTLADASPRTLFNGSYTKRPAVACATGGPCLVAWEYSATWGQPGEVKALRVGSDGVPLDAAPLALSGLVGAQRPSVAYNGSQFIVAWQDDKTAASATDVRTVAVNPTTGAVTPVGVGDLSATPERETAPVTASDSAGRTAILYERWVSPVEGGNTLVKGRFHLALPLGATCTDPNHCLTGLCVDGVCCDSACGDGDLTDCLACSQDLGATTSGTCGPVMLGRVCRLSAGSCDLPEACDGINGACPDDAKSDLECRPAAGDCDLPELCDGLSNDCPDDLKSDQECRPSLGDCDLPDFCDGLTDDCPDDEKADQECRPVGGPCDLPETCDGVSDLCPDDSFLPDTEVCLEAGCAEGLAHEQTLCTGLAADCPDPVTTSCGLYACGELLCRDSCEAQTHCAPDHLCFGGLCVVPIILGQGCEDRGQCASNFCVDGVCCDTECEGQCEACDLDDAAGTCTPVEGQPRGDRSPCTTDDSACAGACDGQEPASCTYPGEETICRPGSCEEGLAVLQALCQGTGLCPELQQQACGNYRCGETACAGDCEDDSPCATGAWCSAGICIPQLAQGDDCGGPNQCQTGFCVDGVCCVGLCSEASCDGSLFQPRGTCNDTGTCTTPDAQDCAPYPCSPQGCLETCDDLRPCSEGFLCEDAACVPELPTPDVLQPDLTADVAVDLAADLTADLPEVVADTAAPDAATSSDLESHEPRHGSGGCSAAPGATPPLTLLLLLALLSLARRRRTCP